MIKWLLHRAIRRMERETDYDASYMHEVLNTSLKAGIKLSLLPLMSQHREDAPAELWHGAALASVLEGDCGPCAQLLINFALADGIQPDLLRAMVARDFGAMSDEARLGFQFSEAAMADKPETMELREQIRQQYGERTLVALAFAITFSRSYPVFKRALGHGTACQKLTISGLEESVVKQAA